MTMQSDDMIRCSEHGIVPWGGDLVCSNCGKVFLAERHEETRTVTFVPDVPRGICPGCGKRLLGGITFTARIACRACATKRFAEQSS
jgi:DNA-directed RNA polymerase subunit RPC12/RpoP